MYIHHSFSLTIFIMMGVFEAIHQQVYTVYMSTLTISHHVSYYNITSWCFLYLVAVLTLGFEQQVYTFSEVDIVANVCISIVNGSVERVVQFEVQTGIGSASGRRFLPCILSMEFRSLCSHVYIESCFKSHVICNVASTLDVTSKTSSACIRTQSIIIITQLLKLHRQVLNLHRSFEYCMCHLDISL